METAKALSPDEWAAEWARTDPKTVGASLSLSKFADLCNAIAAERRERWPRFRWDNARYPVHVEDCLAKGIDVPDAYLGAVTYHSIRYDWMAFPHLMRRLAEIDPDARRALDRAEARA